MPAHAQVSADAATVHLRKDCTGYVDCFVDADADPDDGLAALQLWIWDDPTAPRDPDASAPLRVDVGPGAFSGALACPSGGGHVTFRGAGRERTRIVGASGATITAQACTKLGFQDLTVESGPAPGDVAVSWVGGGDSDWSDVDLEGRLAAWFDTSCPGNPASDGFAGEHYFWDARLRAESWGFSSDCGQSWLYGGEIRVEPGPNAVAYGVGYAGVTVAHRGDVRLFGSAVRVSGASVGGSASEAFYGVRVGRTVNAAYNPLVAAGYGDFHFHGGLVSVDTSTIAGADANALAAERFAAPLAASALAHTPGTTFEAVAGPGGTARRLHGGAHPEQDAGRILSPQLWSPGDGPPAIATLRGQDLYVETDCGGPGGACSGASTPEPHLLVSWPEVVPAPGANPWPGGCASGWWDTAEGATGACYQP